MYLDLENNKGYMIWDEIPKLSGLSQIYTHKGCKNIIFPVNIDKKIILKSKLNNDKKCQIILSNNDNENLEYCSYDIDEIFKFHDNAITVNIENQLKWQEIFDDRFCKISIVDEIKKIMHNFDSITFSIRQNI